MPPRRAAWILASVGLVAGCDAAPLGHRGSADSGAPHDDAAAVDGGGVVDASSAIDASGTDATSSPDAWLAPDTGPACMPTRTSCHGELECGALPDGCPGGTFDCGPCGDGTDWCEVRTSLFHDRTYNCVQMVQAANDAWFDPVMFRDTSSWLVLDASAVDYVAAVAGCVNGGGRVAIPDPNAPGNEIRVRADTGTEAENLLVRTYGTGRTATHYTSTCSPAGF